MRCPRCGFASEPSGNICQRCGASLREEVASGTSTFQPSQYVLTLDTNNSYAHHLQAGNTLHYGRYLLTEQVHLPANQKDQGPAWLATDAAFSNQQVFVRAMLPPGEMSKASFPYERTCRTIAQQLAELGKHEGLPQVIELFYEQDTYFLVSRHPQGRTLSLLLQQRSGPLPEAVVVEYGQQLCDILIRFGGQQPPFVHGAIHPETIMVSEDVTHVSLAYLPLFPPQESKNLDKTLPSYRSPEQTHGTLTPSSDLYSVAAVLYFALTGHMPQGRKAFFYPPLRQFNPLATAHIETILARQLRMSVPQRYATPYEMQQDLIGLIDSFPEENDDELSAYDPAMTVMDDPHLMTPQQRREWRRSNDLLTIGVYAAVCMFLILGLLFAILRP